ncbi:MAG: hypothetical protein KDB90_10525 [Planctomycetes bacterium]|nr:hypothetical protein [Planctomycetota bacterium]
MLEPTALLSQLQHLPDLIGGALHTLAQSGPPFGDPATNPYGSPYDTGPKPLPVGALVVGFLIGIGINVLFGFWGKSRAEQHNVHPGIGFALGFFLSWIGVAMVPVFKKDRVFNPGGGVRYQAPPPNAPNPMYGTPQQYPPQGYAPGPPQQYPAPQYPTQGPMMAGQGIAPPPPPPPQQPQVLTADAQGYVACPGCGARTKAGRKTCMSCGGAMPPVYNPNIR